MKEWKRAKEKTAKRKTFKKSGKEAEQEKRQ